MRPSFLSHVVAKELVCLLLIAKLFLAGWQQEFRLAGFSRPLRTARVGPYCGRSTKASVKRADVPCARIWNISISDAFRRLHWKPEGDEKRFGVSAACQGMSWLGEAIEISRAPADASEHGRHMGIARQRSYQDRRRPGANCQVGKSRREEP